MYRACLEASHALYAFWLVSYPSRSGPGRCKSPISPALPLFDACGYILSALQGGHRVVPDSPLLPPSSDTYLGTQLRRFTHSSTTPNAMYQERIRADDSATSMLGSVQLSALEIPPGIGLNSSPYKGPSDSRRAMVMPVQCDSRQPPWLAGSFHFSAHIPEVTSSPIDRQAPVDALRT